MIVSFVTGLIRIGKLISMVSRKAAVVVGGQSVRQLCPQQKQKVRRWRRLCQLAGTIDAGQTVPAAGQLLRIIMPYQR